MLDQEYTQTVNAESSPEVNSNSIVKETLIKKGKSYFMQPSFIFNALIVLLLFLILFLHNPPKIKPTVWEYKATKYSSLGYERSGEEAFQQTSIYISEEQLNEMGKEGWELVSTSLEMETAYPNFGSVKFVTGLQPNIRPRALICLFKRPINK